MGKSKLLNLWSVGPIDYWSGMIDLSKHNVQDFAMEYENPGELAENVSEMLARAKTLAKKAGWEGDISQGPFLGAIPKLDGSPSLIIGWKQSNNGTCFIASHTLLGGHGYGVPAQQG